MTQVIARFDENIITKASKNQVEEVYQYIDKKCLNLDQLEKFKSETEKKINTQLDQMRYSSKLIEENAQRTQHKMHKELQSMTLMLKGSALEDEALKVDGKRKGADEQVQFMLENKMQEFYEKLKKKSNSEDTEMLIRQINMIHN